MVDREKGNVDRRIFPDPSIYLLELDSVFARGWVFVAHDSQITSPGYFCPTFIGDDHVMWLGTMTKTLSCLSILAGTEATQSAAPKKGTRVDL